MKIIVAVTGASGSLYAQCLFDKLNSLRSQIDEVCVVFSKTAKDVWKHEMSSAPNIYDFTEYADSDFFRQNTMQ